MKWINRISGHDYTLIDHTNIITFIQNILPVFSHQMEFFVIYWLIQITHDFGIQLF